jgi:hypothetical protein
MPKSLFPETQVEFGPYRACVVENSATLIPLTGNKKRDLSEKILVGLKPFHVGLLISAQENLDYLF